eukprot:TRINITY_DN810_c0_g1_i1.p2 TRINITY_DN810_c0_g1~~TRINITY_DN810_c0_g1_i1.p2  ORF type:complete len:101 (-),score=21.94 TRINITY_DN810_c0_g1_i1:470-772(-)
MGICSSSSIEGKSQSDAIDRELKESKAEMDEEVKLLLLGMHSHTHPSSIPSTSIPSHFHISHHATSPVFRLALVPSQSRVKLFRSTCPILCLFWTSVFSL